jgi:Protein of unknown function (DUF3828)
MRILIALALALACAGPAAAQSQDDPVATVRAFYAKDSIRAAQFYSKRLKALFAEDDRKAGGEIGNLDFAFHVNAQDTEDGWQKTLRLALLSKAEKRAEVKAAFKNFEPQDIRYDMVLENGRWLIDDARSLGKTRWRLSTILAKGQ